MVPLRPSNLLCERKRRPLHVGRDVQPKRRHATRSECPAMSGPPAAPNYSKSSTRQPSWNSMRWIDRQARNPCRQPAGRS